MIKICGNIKCMCLQDVSFVCDGPSVMGLIACDKMASWSFTLSHTSSIRSEIDVAISTGNGTFALKYSSTSSTEL